MRDGRSSVPPAWLPLVPLAALFAWNVWNEYFIGDDAYISFRYARHLTEGLGLVWNPGQRVEGYTNFLWVLVMAAALRLGLGPEGIANALGIASGVGVLVLLLDAGRREHGVRDPFLWVAPFALAANRSFAAWATGGLETMLFTLLVLGSLLCFLRERERRLRWPWLSSLLFGLATLTRPDGALFAVVAGLFFLGEVAVGRRSLRSALFWVVPGAVLVGSHLLWRHAYYGFWLPNSFYAKVPGLWWDQGLRYLALFASDYRILPCLPLAAAGLVLRPRFDNVLFASAVFLHLACVVAVGGDRFEFRMLVFTMPLLFQLMGEGVRGIADLGGTRRRLPVRVAGALGVALVANMLLGGRSARALHEVRWGVAPISTIRGYAARRADEGRFLRKLVEEGRLPADLVICVGGAGALPYYSRLTTVDRRGLNDLEVARIPVKARGLVGHERDAPLEYLRERDCAIFDTLNQVVHDRDETLFMRRLVRHRDGYLPLQVVRADDRYLIFTTLVPEEEFRRIFGRLEIRD